MDSKVVVVVVQVVVDVVLGLVRQVVEMLVVVVEVVLVVLVTSVVGGSISTNRNFLFLTALSILLSTVFCGVLGTLNGRSLPV